ncbi:hypothetical protein CCACVL1_19911 [Corchorus capsularis]|uniref:non-specific serine/threonine protein kinase n=1 Tax=Corchorus capsularis TaxID=210143 RepID=A0A1R3HDZ7_COCAP|nr:hypothetical protein CCACVL1_19911 [Corchorus capsularis]
MENPSSSPPFPPELDLDNLKAIKTLGKGAMGTVFLVHDTLIDPTARSPFALKVVQRSKHDADRRARWEIGVLSRLSPSDTSLQHPFLPRLLGRLETPEFIAWAVPYCPGSDLNVLRDDCDLTSEKVTPGKIDIREYFESLKAPTSMPPSPLPSPDHRRNVSFAEY